MSSSNRLSLSHWGAFEGIVTDGNLVGARRFSQDKHPSPLIEAIPSAVNASCRINRPMVRESFLAGRRQNNLRGAEPFIEICWDQALDLVAEVLEKTRSRSGNHRIFGGSYGWASAGRVNHARTLLHRFLNGFGGFVEQETNYSWGAAAVLLPHIVGDIRAVAGPVTDWRSICRKTDLMVLFGGAHPKNGRVTSGGAGSHDYYEWLRLANESGVDFVVISPNKKDCPDGVNAQWIPIRPGTDTALILALSYELEVANRADRIFLEKYTTGFDAFRNYLVGSDDGVAKTCAWASRITGIPADIISNLAKRLVAGRTMLSAAWSLQRAEYGEQPYWAIISLAAMIGQIGLPGGGFGFGYGSINGMGTPRNFIATPTMTEGENPISCAIPVARFSDMLLNPGETYNFNGETRTYPDIDLIYWAGGNPFHHQQDVNKLLEAWKVPSTIIVHEPWWTATAKRADIVLPATTPLERDDIGSSPRDRFIFAMPKIIEPVGESRNDYDIFTALATRLGFEESFTQGRSIIDWIKHCYEVAAGAAENKGVVLPEFAEFWAAGYLEIPPTDDEFVLFKDFRSDPDRFPLATDSGKIELFSRKIASFNYADCAGHARWYEPRECLCSPLVALYPLHLISTQPAVRLHSQLDQADASKASKISGREPIWINSDDAAHRGIVNGMVVRVFNERGSCLAGALVTDEIMAGVVKFETGAWFDPVDPASIGSLDKHGNPNLLTRDAGTSALGQGSIAQSALVEIAEWTDELPEITAFSPPSIVSRVQTLKEPNENSYSP